MRAGLNWRCAVLRCSYDEHVHEKHAIGDPSKRAFTYFVLTGGRFIYASALRVAVLKFILSMTVRAAQPFLLAFFRPAGFMPVLLLLRGHDSISLCLRTVCVWGPLSDERHQRIEMRA
jgi:hypothetical protein